MTRFAYDTQIADAQDAARAALNQFAPPPLDPARPILFSGIGTSPRSSQPTGSPDSAEGGRGRTRSTPTTRLLISKRGVRRKIQEPGDKSVITR
jgi:hypothetical protein